MKDKICYKCKETKPLDQFYSDKYRKDGVRSYCIICSTKYAKDWHDKHRESSRKSARKYYQSNSEKIKAYNLMRRYGLTLEDREILLEKQGGGCAICGVKKAIQTSGKFGEFSVDHNHTTGKIRGLLCPGCNVGLGYFKENPDSLLKAVEYLKEHVAG